MRFSSDVLWAMFVMVFALFFVTSACAQGLVIAASHDGKFEPLNGDPLVVVPDLSRGFLNRELIFVAPPEAQTGVPMKPHGIALLSSQLAIVNHLSDKHTLGFGDIEIVDLALAKRVATIDIPDYRADGGGSVAVNPSQTHLLVFSGRSNQKLFVVSAPFSASSPVNEVVMPGNGAYAQVRAIVFDNSTERAYVAHRNGISALDPPYTTIAFTIPLSVTGVDGRAVALSSDGAVMATTNVVDNVVDVLHAPFTAASTPQLITVNGANVLDGLTFSPDDQQLLVVDPAATTASGSASVEAAQSSVVGSSIAPAVAANATMRAYAIAAPFSSTSLVDTLDTGLPGAGFEDVDISADGRFAALSGNDQTGAPLVILRAPFTSATVGVATIDIPPLLNGYGIYGGRGTGAARFWHTAIPTLPQITPEFLVRGTEGDAGTSPQNVALNLSRPSSQTIKVDYATSDDSSLTPTRYIATSGTVTFAPGETHKLIPVPIVGDQIEDGGFVFYMTFSNPVNASLLENNARLVCTVDDNENRFVMTTSSPLADGFVGAPFSLTFGAEGSPGGYTNWTVYPLGPDRPEAVPGLQLDANSGILSGVPTQRGNFLLAVSVCDSTNATCAERGYEITIRSDRIFADGFD